MHGSLWHATEGAEGGSLGARSLIIVHKGGRKRQLNLLIPDYHVKLK